MKKILLFFLAMQLSSSASVILYTDVPESLKNLLHETETEVHYQVNKNPDYLFELSTYEPHISLAYLCKKGKSLKVLFATEPLLKDKLMMLAHYTAPINMDNSLNNLEIELWQTHKPSSYLGKTYNNGIILVIKIPVPQTLYAFTQEIDKEMESLPTIDKRTFEFQAHATIGWLYHKDDINPTDLAEHLKTILQNYIDRFNEQKHEFTINSFVLAAGNQTKKFIFQKAKTSNAFQPDRSRPCARPALPGCSYRRRACTPAQNACPRSR